MFFNMAVTIKSDLVRKVLITFLMMLQQMSRAFNNVTVMLPTLINLLSTSPDQTMKPLSSFLFYFTTRLTLATLEYFRIHHGDQRFFLIQNHHKCLIQLFPIHLNRPIYVMGIRLL